MTKRAPFTQQSLDNALDAIGNANEDYRFLIDLDPDGAARAIGSEGPLQGTVIGVKGNIAVAGLANTAGSAARRDHIADADAPIIKKLRAAGASIIGTLNMHEGALGATTRNEAFGIAINPWRNGYTPGGSSGGSGAAVASGLFDAALGSDTMGSIRIPAAYCGVFGYKPGGNWLSKEGVVPLAPSLEQIGPLAPDADRLIAVASAMGAPPPSPIAGSKIGVLTGYGDIPEPVQALMDKAAAQLKAFGAILVPFRFDLELSGFDMLKYGLLVCEADGAVEWANELASEESGLSPSFRGMLNYGASLSPDKLSQARERLAMTGEAIRNQINSAGLDAILSPTATETAFPQDGPVPPQANWTVFANVANLPAVSCPAGLLDGLPIGVQLVAKENGDAIVLGLTQAFNPLRRDPKTP
jgi:aspartyl-tRNA(Asn)/glutamyl-tRNA(Gln) amidotransferase subunit A